jgi:hypothetical protein
MKRMFNNAAAVDSSIAGLFAFVWLWRRATAQRLSLKPYESLCI